MSGALQRLRKECQVALSNPTAKQKEAYGRLLHTLCAASLAGAVTLAWSAKAWSWYEVARVGSLLVAAVVAFLLGALFSKGD